MDPGTELPTHGTTAPRKRIRNDYFIIYIGAHTVFNTSKRIIINIDYVSHRAPLFWTKNSHQLYYINNNIRSRTTAAVFDHFFIVWMVRIRFRDDVYLYLLVFYQIGRVILELTVDRVPLLFYQIFYYAPFNYKT